MNLYERIVNKKEQIIVIGIGYVGLPLAIAFAKKVKVVGFDINEDKIKAYRRGKDITNEVGDEAIYSSTCIFTSREKCIANGGFFVIAVPTPISIDKTPDLSPVISASEIAGRNLKKGDIVVYESTVYPGVTRDICIPILEKNSGLVCGRDFKVGYSPERINPGDKVHRLENITKIVAGYDKEALEIIKKIYSLIIKAGVYCAESIEVAEAAKVVENSQRDINIAFMNEIAMVFDKMGVDTQSVIRAMNTKWNALGFYPGLVGGHCISVDPYYFIYKASQIGYHSQIISSARKVNDGMSEFVAFNIVKQLIYAEKKVKGAHVAIYGIAFKENCPDVRNSKVIDIICELKKYGISVDVVDPIANQEECMREYGIMLVNEKDLGITDAVVIAVAHDVFKQIPLADRIAIQRETPVLIDIKGIYSRSEAYKTGCNYWRL